MKKLILIPLISVLVTGCAAFGPKTKLVPQAYMPEPPELLMRKPKDLKTIKTDEAEPDTTPETQANP